MVTQTRLTLEEFLALSGIDEQRLELIDGEVYEKVSPTWKHGVISGELYSLLREFGSPSVEPRAIIPAKGNLEGSSPVPDVAFYLPGRPTPPDWMRVAPDIAIEVLSPGQRLPDIRSKIDAYLSFGVREVWVIDPSQRSVDVFSGTARLRLTDADTLKSDLIPGLRIGLADFFDRAGA
ncbi:MAG: Uma2 family endonuclease [Dehalococcoidia bacterium]